MNKQLITSCFVIPSILAAFVNWPLMAELTAETFIYTSYTTNSFAELFDKSYKTKTPVRHKVKLWTPKKTGVRFPVIVMQHGIGPPNKYKKWLNIALPKFLSEGFAVIMNDSYSARTMKNPKRLSFSSRILDNIMLFNSLVNDSRFDPKNINIQGFSYGGMVAYHMAYKAYQPLLHGTWNSHLSMYGACDIILADSSMSGAPVLMYLASNEDRQLNHDCLDYKKKFGGFDIFILNSSYHGFAMDYEVQIEPKQAGFTRCDTGPQNKITKDGKWLYNKKIWSGSYDDIIAGIWNDCGSTKKSFFGGSVKTKTKAINDSIKFFKKNISSF